MTGTLLGILGYVMLQLGIGVWVSRRIRSEDDYLVAGRSLGPVLASASVFATWFGAETCVGAAGEVYSHGLTRTSVEPFAYGLCLVLMGLLFAAAFWRRRITTLADLFHGRYGRSTETLAAVLLIPTSLLWAAAQVRAFGNVIATGSPISLETGIAIAAAIAIVYTVFGGLLADVLTDLVQGGALVLGLVVLLVAVIADLGGVAETVAAIDPDRIRLVGGQQPGLLATVEAWAIPVLGSLVAQEVVSRSLAARSAGVARAAGLAGGGIYVLVGLIPVTLGLLGPRLMPGLEDGEQLLPALAREHLAPFLYVLFAGALVSAILSTVDSALLVASSLLSRNVVLTRRIETVSERTKLGLARAGVVVFGTIAWGLAHSSEGVFALVEEASGFGSAGILVIVTFGLFTKRGGAWAANLALTFGILVWVLGYYVAGEFPYPYLCSFAAALLGFGVGSYAQRTALSPRSFHRP